MRRSDVPWRRKFALFSAEENIRHDGDGSGKRVLFAKFDKGVTLDHKVFTMIDDFVV